MWRKIKKVGLPMVKKFWVMANPDDKILDLTNVLLSQWIDSNDWCYIGMKLQDSGLEHGVVRVIQPHKPNQSISERTYRNGKIHGLNRMVSANSVKVSLYKEGVELAYFAFD